jgi:MobA/MobL family
MDELDRRLDFPNGGHARGGSGCFHLSFRSGSRGGGACASSAYAYISRTGEYSGPDRDEAIYEESGHMPSWAADDAAEYWDAADLHERANGRLYVSADFALPLDLDREDQIVLARAFVAELTDEEKLPYTLAIHAGLDADGEEHNPHAHLMFSERQNDGIERERDLWFRRADPEHSEQGGAPKSRSVHGREWVEHARERWAELTNAALARSGRTARVDHRSYERQGIDREPGQHYGPSALHLIDRGHQSERLERAADVADRDEVIQAIELEIIKLETARENLVRYGLPDEERPPEARDDSHSSGPDRSDDTSPGR